MTVTAHAARTYRARPPRRRAGLALCLSGGGYRAALFHLGGLRRLNELGVLSQLDVVSAVSGGALIAAHLADRLRAWPPRGRVIDPFEWEERIAAPFRAFARRDVRSWPLLKRFLFWPLAAPAAETLAAGYRRHLTRLTLRDLPRRPVFIFCATDMVFGENWLMQRRWMGNAEAGYAAPPPPWPVARAAAASSCFPPLFNPMKVSFRPEVLRCGRAAGPERDHAVANLRLTDGGNYDNMGLEPVWQRRRVVLVSDGGATFRPERDRHLLWRLSRYTEIQGNQSVAVRKRWLISNYISGELDGAYWGVGSDVRNYGGAFRGYPAPLVDGAIAPIRTDMDGFSEGEMRVLENHGYLLADAAVRTHAPALIVAGAPPPEVPHEEWMEEARAARALRHSHRRHLRGLYLFLDQQGLI